MASITAIREGLKTRLATVTGLKAHATIPSQLTPPAAVVGMPEAVQYLQTYGSGAYAASFPVRLLVAKVDDGRAQEKLDAYCGATGATSVKAAIEGAGGTLGGVVDFVVVQQVRGFGVYEVAGVAYLGAEFVVEVMASGG